ncbi:TPA: helix-turn-helix domain-containing protein [Vibrio harveyi]
MSIEVTSKVWEICAENGIKGTKLLIMARLADYADENWSCRPSLQTIADQVGAGRSTVTTAIRELEKDGWLARVHRKKPDGKNASNRYFLNKKRIAGLALIKEIEKRKSDGSESDSMVQNLNYNGSEFDGEIVQKLNHLGGSESEPDPSLDPSIDPSIDPIGEKSPKSPFPRKYSKLDFSPLGFSDEHVLVFIQIRESRNAGITQAAINRLKKHLDQTREAGYTNDQIIDVWVDKGWKGFELDWMRNATKNKQIQPQRDYRQIAHGEFTGAPEGWDDGSKYNK